MPPPPTAHRFFVFLASDNYIHDNKDAGIAFFETFDSEIYGNKVEDCKFGIRLSLGCARNKIYDNTFSDLTEYGLYTYRGSDDEEADDSKKNDGRPYDNHFDGNTVKNVEIGVQVKDSDDIVFTSECMAGGPPLTQRRIVAMTIG